MQMEVGFSSLFDSVAEFRETIKVLIRQNMQKKERYKACVDYFSENMPVAETELVYESTFQLLVAVVLSAQCTDKRINMVTPALFRDFPTPPHFASASRDELSPYIGTIASPDPTSKHRLGL